MLINKTDMAAIEDDAGQCLLDVLGIAEWTEIYRALNSALDKIVEYSATLNDISERDLADQDAARITARKIATALNREFTVPASDSKTIDGKGEGPGPTSLADCLRR